MRCRRRVSPAHGRAVSRCARRRNVDRATRVNTGKGRRFRSANVHRDASRREQIASQPAHEQGRATLRFSRRSAERFGRNQGRIARRTRVRRLHSSLAAHETMGHVRAAVDPD